MWQEKPRLVTSSILALLAMGLSIWLNISFYTNPAATHQDYVAALSDLGALCLLGLPLSLLAGVMAIVDAIREPRRNWVAPLILVTAVGVILPFTALQRWGAFNPIRDVVLLAMPIVIPVTTLAYILRRPPSPPPLWQTLAKSAEPPASTR
jgi:hypothetical protein